MKLILNGGGDCKQVENARKLLNSLIDHNKKILLNTKDFTSVLRRTLIFARDNKETKNGGIFNFQNNMISLKKILYFCRDYIKSVK